ncbi:MAG: helix-turn-helix domain-containing protein [Archangium sp.]|nr:helix-turn-helix domain-containing protein [Archangium sp.]MDP3574125.1 helix-turn-helix domain-containing protein [Archangium sp.]
MKSFQAQTHYEVLEISVGASSAEVRGSHERLVRLYSDDQAALYGLVDPAHSAALRKRLDQALEILGDDELRELYDAEIGLPPRVVKGAVPPASRPSVPALVLVPKAPQPNPLPKGEGAQQRFASFSYVTPTAPPPSQPAAYTYAVVPPPVMVVPVPARILAEPPAPAPAPEPSQLALDVSPGVPSWGAKPVAPEPLPAPVVEEPAPVVVAEPPRAPEPEKPAPIPEVPPMPMLGDDVQVAIIPARATPNREFRLEQRPRPYEIPEGVEINGDLLKQVRMAKGLSLVQVADRTRIGVKHLENVEGDRYDALPAAVYLRGILMNLARELGLDGLRVSRSYLTFVEAHRSKG